MLVLDLFPPTQSFPEFLPDHCNFYDNGSELQFSEPGYYEDGNFGIRLENVLIIKEADTKFNFGDKGYLSFEHITWVSFCGSSYFEVEKNIICPYFYILFTPFIL